MTLQNLGQTIREKREGMGLSIEEVAERVKVSARTLRAIEDGSLAGLPHTVYTKGFVRSFALAVGYNPEELNTHLHRVFPPEAFNDAKPEPSPLIHPLNPHGVGRKIAFLAFLLVLLLGIVAGGWYLTATYGDEIVKLIKQPFSAVTPAPESNTTANNTTSLPIIEGTALKDIAGNTASTPSTPAPATTSTTPPTTSAGAAIPVTGVSLTATPNTAPVENVHTLRIVARASCWISTKVDGGAAQQYIVKAGEEFSTTFKTRIDAVVKKPTGVTIYYDDQEYKPAHEPNQRARFTLP